MDMIVHPDADTLADHVAARLLRAVADAVAQRGRATIALTGGGVGTKTLAAARRLAEQSRLDWTCVDIWWGDDRFVSAHDTDRNELQAREAFLDHVDVPPENIHPMPAAGGGLDVHEAARGFCDYLIRRQPKLDIVLLGVGPDGHVASLFPDRADLITATAPIVAVTQSPKPPPERLSFSLPVINSAREVWLLAAGDEKAPAVRDARLAGSTLPAAQVRGIIRTVWLLDTAAAAASPAK